MSELVSDIVLLKIFSNRKNYFKFIDKIVLNHLEEETKSILLAYKEYFESTGHEDVDFEQFPTWFHHYKNPDLSESALLRYRIIFDRIAASKMELAEDVILGLYTRTLRQKIVKLCNEDFNFEKLTILLDKYKERNTRLFQDTQLFKPLSADRIRQSLDREHGLKYSLKELQENIIPIDKPDFHIVAGGSDLGKTSFLLTQVTEMAKTLTEGKIVWLNNEEDEDIVQDKMVAIALKSSLKLVKKYSESAVKKYEKEMNGDADRIVIINIVNTSLEDIIPKILHLNPKLVVIDRLDKVFLKNSRFKDGGAEHDRLTEVCAKVREVAKAHFPVIGTLQTDASCTYVDRTTQEIKYIKYPEQTQLYKSKIGVPGEADVIITIGRDNNCPNVRGMRIAKNKRGKKRCFDVHFNEDTLRYEDPE